MTALHASPDSPPSPTGGFRTGRARLMVAGVFGLVVLALAAAFFGAVRLAERESERAMTQWRLNLALVAQNRSEAVGEWVGKRLEAVRQVAGNPSVRLLLTLVDESATNAGEARRDDARDVLADAGPERDYARTLLVVAAEQGGLISTVRNVAANLPAPPGGLMLVDREGRPVIGTGSWPEGLARPGADDLRTGPPRVLLHEGAAWLVLMRPVHGIQDADGAAPRGWTIGWTPIDERLTGRLRQGEENAGEGTESYLVARLEDGGLRHLTPLSRRAIERPAGLSLPDPAAEFASANPGRMGRAKDYAGRDVLVVGQRVPLAPDWTVVRTVDADIALAGVRAQRDQVIVFAGLLAVIVAILVLLVWRHGVSVRLAAAHAAQSSLTERLRRQSRFLEAVTDGQPTEILALDPEGRIQFVNRRLMEEIGADREELIGKPVEAALGAHAGRSLRLLAEAARDEGPLQDTLETEDANDERRLFVINAIPLKAGEAHDDELVLLVREEVTAFVEERERRERTLKRLVGTLATLIDARDPYAARQSERVVDVATSIGHGLNLTLREMEAIEIAGRLMNVGKMLVPREILTKEGRLTEEELKLVRDSMKRSADLLAGVEFDGPVVETLRQIQARVDGKGDPPLQGSDILITARVLAVANAFVAMVSPRAHRAGLSIDEALAELQKEAGTRFDRGVVAALAHQIENLDGRRRWAHFSELPADADTDAASPAD